MAQEQGRARFGLQGQDPAGWPSRKLQRPGEARDFRPGDLAPAQHQAGIGEAGAGESAAAAAPCIAGQRRRRGRGAAPARQWLPDCFVGRRSGHGPHYAAPCADRKSPKPIWPQRLLAWYDRHRRVLPWRAPKGQARRSLSGLAVGNHAAADHGAGGGRLLPQIPRALAGCEGAGGARSRTMCSPPGPGLAITPAPAICMPPPRSWPSEMGGKFPATAEGLRALPGIGGYTAGAIAAIAYDERQAAMDANAERVIARLYAVDNAAAQGQGRTARAWAWRWCRSGQGISRRR